MKRKNKRLHLGKENIRVLSGTELRKIVGRDDTGIPIPSQCEEGSCGSPDTFHAPSVGRTP